MCTVSKITCNYEYACRNSNIPFEYALQLDALIDVKLPDN